MQRHATLHVVDGSGRPLGTFSCVVPMPYLQETSDVLTAARGAGLELSVLRLLDHRIDHARGLIECSYLAEANSTPSPGALLPALTAPPLDDHPLRRDYARLGGVARDLAWADARLRELGLSRAGAAQQQRTWNLSCVHRLPLAGGAYAWLKVVPPFFAQEGRVIELLTTLERAHGAGSTLVLPPLLARDASHGRVLLAHCEGSLMWGTTLDAWAPVVVAHVERQLRLRDHVEALLEAGVADWRAPALLAGARALCAREDVIGSLPPDVRAGVDDLVADLPARLDAIARCGLPDTLVHGDLSPGNVVADRGRHVLLDWGDAAVGLPLLDLPALCRTLDARASEEVRALVAASWTAHLPGSDVARAMRLMPPLDGLLGALVYQRFVDHIEPAERHYHRDDVTARLVAAVRAVRDPETTP